MENLPTPLSRVELYLAKACGMDVTVPEQPESRLEQFLAVIAGDTSVELPVPASLTELWLNFVAGGALTDEMKLIGAYWIGAQKVDVRFFAVAGGMDGVELPVPQNRTELYWAKIAETLPVHGVLKYATGTSITLTDVVRGITSLENVYGDTFQQTYAGKNKFDYESASDTNNTFISTYRLFEIEGLKPNTTYTISNLGFTSTLAGKYVYLWNDTDYATSNKIMLADPAGYKSSASLGTNNGAKLYLAIFPIDDTIWENVITYFENAQIEEGATATSFEPYVGGMPAPNPDYPQDVNVVTGEQTVTVTGKNLFNKDGGNTLNTVVDANGIGSNVPNTYRTVFAPCQPNTTYTVSKAFDSTRNRFSIAYTKTIPTYNMSEVYGRIFDNTKSALTITTGADAKYIVAYVWITGGSVSANDMVASVQIEEGATSSDYESYQGADYTIDLGSIELCKIGAHQDYIYKSGTDWYVHKTINGVTLNGSEIWTGTGSVFQTLESSTPNKGDLWRDAYSNYFVHHYYPSAITINIKNGEFGWNGASLLTVRDDNITGSANFKTWLSTHNLDVYYIVSTATDTKITDSTLISQLNALSRATLPKPVAYLTVGATSPNLPASIKISYYGEEE